MVSGHRGDSVPISGRAPGRRKGAMTALYQLIVVPLFVLILYWADK